MDEEPCRWSPQIHQYATLEVHQIWRHDCWLRLNMEERIFVDVWGYIQVSWSIHHGVGTQRPGYTSHQEKIQGSRPDRNQLLPQHSKSSRRSLNEVQTLPIPGRPQSQTISICCLDNFVIVLKLIRNCWKPSVRTKLTEPPKLTKEDIHQAKRYLFTKGTQEIKKFVRPSKYKKISNETDGILY